MMDSAVVALLDTIFPVMLYPDNAAARTGAFWDAIFSGSDKVLRDCWQGDPDGRGMMLASYRLSVDTAKPPADHLRDFQNRASAGNMAALILAALVEMEQEGIRPSVNLAVKFALKEEHRSERWIRDSWSRFKAVSPLWLAWNLFLRNKRDEITGVLPNTQNEVDYFLGWVRYLFGVATRTGGIGFGESIRAVSGADLGRFYMAIRPSFGVSEIQILSDSDRKLIAAIYRPPGRPATKT